MDLENVGVFVAVFAFLIFFFILIGEISGFLFDWRKKTKVEKQNKYGEMLLMSRKNLVRDYSNLAEA